MLRGMWDLSSPTRDRTMPLKWKLGILTIGLPGNYPKEYFNTVFMEEEMATHSSTLAWKIAWTGEPGGLQFTGSQRVRRDWACTHTIRNT